MLIGLDPDMNFLSIIKFSETQAALIDELENIDDGFLWLEEILTECKNQFSTTTDVLLPKTPCQKKPPRKKTRKVIKEDDEVFAERSPIVNQPSVSEPAATPVRRLRSRSVQQNLTSTNTTRSSRANTRKKEKETAAIKDSRVEKGLPSVSENHVLAQTPPQPTASSHGCSSLADSGRKNVRQKAREYENMLVQKLRVSGSPRTLHPQPAVISPRTPTAHPAVISPHTPTAHPVVISPCSPVTYPPVVNSKTAHAGPAIEEGKDVSTKARRSSAASRRSSAARGGRAFKVLASKAKLRSLHGRSSMSRVQAVVFQQTSQENQQEREPDTDPEQSPKAEGSSQEVDPSLKSQPKTSRTRLRLKKTKNGTETASENNSTSDSATDSSKDVQLTSPTGKDSQPATSTRTKRKKQKSQSSEDEQLRVPVKLAKRKMSRASDENEVKTRTGTRSRKMEQSDCDASFNEVFESSAVTEKAGTLSDPAVQDSHSSLTESQSCQTDADSGLSSTTGTACEPDRVKGAIQSEPADTGAVENCSTDSDTTSAEREMVHKEDNESPRRLTRVISTGEAMSEKTLSEEEEVPSRQSAGTRSKTKKQTEAEEESQPARSTRTKTRQAQQAKAAEEKAGQNDEQEDEEAALGGRMTRTKTRKRHVEEDADTSLSKRSCIETSSHQAQVEPQPRSSSDDVMEVDDEGVEADDDSDYEDIEPTCPPAKVVRPVPSFLNQMKKKSFTRPASLVSGVVTSFLNRNTPIKPTFQVAQAQKKKELLMKERREQERLSKMDEMKKNKVEELKRKREERTRKVAEMRELRQKKENDLKRNLAEKLKEKLNSTDRMKEDRVREEREKQRLRLKKQLEADMRRKQEEEDRLRKLLEQQEEQKRLEEMMQRKREQEEQERQRRLAEERRRLEEKQAELERERQAENVRRRQEELARERERQLEKERREKTAAQERAEREKLEMERRKEREQRIQREMEKLEEMRQERIAKTAAYDEVKRLEAAKLQQVVQQHNNNLDVIRAKIAQSVNTNMTVVTNTANTTITMDQNHNPNSYQMTPVRSKKGSAENYDIDDLRSDDSTDDDEAPRKRIPSWAQGANLNALLINQAYHPPDLDSIFCHIQPPDLNEMFERKRPRFNKRTSSAVWNSPLQKSHS